MCYSSKQTNKLISLYLRHEAERLEQEAKGRLERQKISDEAEAEKSRRNLLELQAHSAAVESTGQAKAEAQSRAEASRIEGEAAVEQAKLKVMANQKSWPDTIFPKFFLDLHKLKFTLLFLFSINKHS